MNPLKTLSTHGQSVWLDFIDRKLMSSGDLSRLIDADGVRGMTSNPSIFEKALAASTDYDDSLRAALAKQPDIDVKTLYETLVIEDIRSAADVLRTVYDESNGDDGYVSLEVSPKLANDTAATIEEAKRLWAWVDRPNLMVKVPATGAGVPAVEALIAAGLNINVTLMFSLQHYEDIAQAYIRGLARCEHPERVASVASFFVSRVEAAVDEALHAIGTEQARAVQGKTAVANAKLAYKRFGEIFGGASFSDLRAKGGRVQRPLWASTSTKNPDYNDVMYVEELIGPDTVNTLPPATLEAFRDHGKAARTIDYDVPAAQATFDTLELLGIDLDAITEQLQMEGVAAFESSFETLIAALQEKLA
jgi:transaldolase